ncbi:hypothetical protein [Streptomyces flavofungini]|uniref:hypothetical protein n=1 Tax=Streptomyces flavofungini TaxID=68200 RepID=UPI0034DDFA9A
MTRASSATVAGLTAAALLACTVPAFANGTTTTGETARESAAAATLAVEKATGTESLSIPRTRADGTLIAEAGGSRVELPAMGSGTFTVTDAHGKQLRVGLPGSSAATARVTPSGTVVYSRPADSVDVAAQVGKDGSASALITLKDATAPTEYRFALDLPSGARAVADEDGGVLVVDGAGDLVGTFQAPWAKDAHGRPVATSYRVKGDDLVQSIHTDASTAYPVVADPKWWDKTKEIAGGIVSDTWNSMKCGGALAAAFHPGTASYKAIKAAGGVKKLVAVLSGVNSKRGAASALGSGFTTLFGVKSIKKACFDDLK